jgi:membrane protein DedA with SNARE-associated domain
MIDAVINWLEALAQQVDPAVFVFIGSFVEEIIAPIPSPLIMVTTAGLVRSLELGWWTVAWLMLVGAIGKTIAAYIVYVIADRAEDVLLIKYGKYLGLSHASVEKVGRLINRGVWDDVVLFLLRALPIMPSIILSAAGGVLKIDLKTYIVTTFLGTIVRNWIYFAVIYFGLGQLESIWNMTQDSFTLIVAIGLVLAVGLWFALRLKKRLEAKVLR